MWNHGDGLSGANVRHSVQCQSLRFSADTAEVVVVAVVARWWWYVFIVFVPSCGVMFSRRVCEHACVQGVLYVEGISGEGYLRTLGAAVDYAVFTMASRHNGHHSAVHPDASDQSTVWRHD